MLEFFKRLFGTKSAEVTAAPYKVETPKPAEFPFPSTNPAQNKKKPVAKKPAGQARPARKPRKPKAPKA
jgi:hypothetical protein